MNIFLLCGGKGTRFESIYPKPLNLIAGRPMIYHTLTSLQLHKLTNKPQIFIVYNAKLDACSFKETIINMFPALNFHFVLLDYFTRGASESAYMGVKQAFEMLQQRATEEEEEQRTTMQQLQQQQQGAGLMATAGAGKEGVAGAAPVPSPSVTPLSSCSPSLGAAAGGSSPSPPSASAAHAAPAAPAASRCTPGRYASALERLRNGNIIFLDNDTIYPSETWEYLDRVYSSNFLFTNYNHEKHPVYSYAAIDPDSYLVEIKEKIKISDIICVGGYGFKDQSVFMRIFQSLLANNAKTNNEFYMSLIYDRLLAQRRQQLLNRGDTQHTHTHTHAPPPPAIASDAPGEQPASNHAAATCEGGISASAIAAVLPSPSPSEGGSGGFLLPDPDLAALPATLLDLHSSTATAAAPACFPAAAAASAVANALLPCGSAASAAVAVPPTLCVLLNKIVSMGTPKQLMEDRSAAAAVRTKLRYVFDLDNTLVTYPQVNKDYSTVRPIPRMIALLRHLKSDGHTIIIATARRMATHGHNIGAVIADIGAVTLDTLRRFDIPFDEIVFGKPLGDIYIDDRAYNPYDERLIKLLGEYSLVDDDIDNRLANNRYNELRCVDQLVLKTLSNESAGAGELFFYKHLHYLLPDGNDTGIDVRSAFVRYFGYTLVGPHVQLQLEKVEGIPVAYLYTHQTYSVKLFTQLLHIVHKLHTVRLTRVMANASGGGGIATTSPSAAAAAASTPRDSSPARGGAAAPGPRPVLKLESYINNYLPKLRARFANKHHYSFEGAESLMAAIEKRVDEYIRSVDNDGNSALAGNIAHVVHGDLWFSNVLLTYRDEYRLIDMKGMVDGSPTLSGDKIYDYAKLLQSIMGFDAALYHKSHDAAYARGFVSELERWLSVHEPAIRFRHVCAVSACLVFGVFHAYADITPQTKRNIARVVQDILDL